ncbi:MAG: hypothetical protein CVU95_05650 [Firmicutes bacterium HGW-Firmicutes-2]|jgi:lactobin A/cerein 7B family class IIb bacteriocin|nr:MAG: hypothetical protein CVU95_05650 [Firmicutes bacterium HGW-Firmicutes-2]
MELCINKREFYELTNEELGNLNGGAAKIGAIIMENAGIRAAEAAAEGVFIF